MTALANALFAPLARPARGRSLLDLVLSHHRERRALARLDARMLRDVGLSEADALREARRPAWDLAASRL